MRLAVVATHPVQYHAPLFRRLATALDLHVFYCWEGAARGGAVDPGFGRAFAWDVPLLDGYPHSFVPNVAADPGTHHFGGLDNPGLVARVLDWGPDAVLVFGWAWRSHLRALRALHGRVPVLFRGDSTLLDERPGLRRWARRSWLRWVYRHVDVALPAGVHSHAYFRAHGFDAGRLVWMPHAVDNGRFADPGGRHAAEARAWRARLGISDSEVAFLFAGKLETDKDPGAALAAFLALDVPRAHFVVVGSGALEGVLREGAAGHPRVHFLGFRNQAAMPAMYRIGDVLVLPSRRETWGLAVNEAMASGRPAVVSDRVGCAPDLIRPGRTGFTFPAGEVSALRDRMRDLPDRARAHALGLAASRWVHDWSPQAQARALVAAIRLAVGGVPPHPPEPLTPEPAGT